MQVRARVIKKKRHYAAGNVSTLIQSLFLAISLFYAGKVVACAVCAMLFGFSLFTVKSDKLT